MGLFGPPRDAKLKAWKIPTFSLCWTAVLTVFLSNSHRRSNPPGYSTHPNVYGSKRRTAEMAEGSQEADRDWDSSIQVLRCQIKLKSSQYFPIFRLYLQTMTTVMKAAPDQRLDAWAISSDLCGLRIEWPIDPSQQREEGARQPSKAAHLMLLTLKTNQLTAGRWRVLWIQTLPLCLMELQHHWWVKEYMIHVEGQAENSGKG